MNEKRFTSYYERGNEVVIEDNGKRLSNKKVVDLLNTLHQENQQLKHYNLYEDNKRLQTRIADLKKENEQLKSLVNACEYGQKSLMEEMKNSDEALDKIWEIMKELYGAIDI